MVNIGDYIQKDCMIELSGTEKNHAFQQIMASIRKSNLLKDSNLFFEKILQREEQSSTGIGLGVAIPHARVEDLSKTFIAIGRSAKGIDFSTPDDIPVRLIFMIGVSPEKAEYLKILSKISGLVRNEEFRKQLLNCPSMNDLFNLLISQS